MWLVKRYKNDVIYQTVFNTLKECLDHIYNNQDSYKYKIIYVGDHI